MDLTRGRGRGHGLGRGGGMSPARGGRVVVRRQEG